MSSSVTWYILRFEDKSFCHCFASYLYSLKPFSKIIFPLELIHSIPFGGWPGFCRYQCVYIFRIVVEFISSICSCVSVLLGNVPVFCILGVKNTLQILREASMNIDSRSHILPPFSWGELNTKASRPRTKETSAGRGSGILGTERGVGMVFYQDFLWQLVYLTHLLADFSIVLMEDVYQTVNLERQFLVPLACLNCSYQWSMERLHMCSVHSPTFSSPVNHDFSFRLTLLTCMYERELLVLFWSKLIVLLKD